MANTLQQKSRQQKFIYLGAIFALFTLSLVHRESVIRPLARSLQLTEDSRGEVELTSSAVRLALTGSRGLAVTFLWNTALELHEKHQWNELELMVGSITQLQPFFITPWLFQSWNLSFNVAKECDRSRDKYYYVTRGLALLAEGERRNRGLGGDDLKADTGKFRFPGNPELRHFMGFTYQLKFGNSDEKNVMRSLLELSCIDPVRRNPDKLRGPAPGGGETIPPVEFERLCRDYPRLVRRLRDQLGCDTPKKVLDFLADNRDIPSRFELPEGVSDPRQALLKPWHKQFPLLPDPRERDRDWPNSERDQLNSNEWVDVFVIARTWYSYALKTTPPPIRDPLAPVEYDPVKYRLPKMAMVLFASYPARAQTYVAEGLQSEGWFGSEGWLASAAYAKNAFLPTALDSRGEFRPGQADAKFSSQEAWQKAHRAYETFGRDNGIYFPAGELEILERMEKEFRDQHPQLNLSQIDIHAYRNNPRWKDHIHAAAKLMWKKKQTDQRISLDDFLAITEAEGSDLAVAARLRFFEADRLRRLAAEPQALALYEEAWPLWLQVLLQHPRFAKAIAEDYYEWHLRHLRMQQNQLAHVIRPLTMVFAQKSVWPYPPFHEQLLGDDSKKMYLPSPAEVLRLWRDGKGLALPGLTPGEVDRIVPVKSVRGMLDEVQYFHLYHPEITKEYLLWWSQVSSASHGMGLTPLVTAPGHATLLLTRQVWFGEIPPPRWDYVMPPGQAESVRLRLGLPRTPPPWEAAMSGMQMPGR